MEITKLRATAVTRQVMVLFGRKDVQLVLDGQDSRVDEARRKVRAETFEALKCSWSDMVDGCTLHWVHD